MTTTNQQQLMIWCFQLFCSLKTHNTHSSHHKEEEEEEEEEEEQNQSFFLFMKL